MWSAQAHALVAKYCFFSTVNDSFFRGLNLVNLIIKMSCLSIQSLLVGLSTQSANLGGECMCAFVEDDCMRMYLQGTSKQMSIYARVLF
jgi:hypothetical protein